MNNGYKYILTSLITIVISAVVTLMLIAGAGILYMNYVYTEPTTTITNATTDETTATNVYNNSKAGVLTVLNKKVVDPNDFFQYYTNASSDGTYTQGIGSGFIYKYEDGYYYALTNLHVVSGSDEIDVYPTPDGQTLNESVTAEPVGYNSDYDIAVLRFKSDEDLQVLPLAEDGDITPGELVFAMGSPFGEEFAGSISHGIVNAPIRTFEQQGQQLNYIQTDAAINPGNSGGPLLNSVGEVVGMNTMKIASEEADNVGLAIPIENIKQIVSQIESNSETNNE